MGKLSLSEYCKEKDRIKEELKWKREELEEILDKNAQSSYAIDLKEVIEELENEWDLLHGEKTITLNESQVKAINDLIDEKLTDLGYIDEFQEEISVLESLQKVVS